MKLYFMDRQNRCSYLGKSKNNPKYCKRKAVARFRGNRVCNFHYSRLYGWFREGRI